MFWLREFSSEDNTMALFLSQRDKVAEDEFGHVQPPSMKTNLCLASRAIITDLFQLSTFSPLKIFATKGILGLSYR